MSHEPKDNGKEPRPAAAPRAAAVGDPDNPREDFTAAAPRDPDAAGAGETSFSDAAAPPAGTFREAEAAASGVADDPAAAAEARAAEYLVLAQRTKADFENFRKRMTREAALAAERGMSKVVKELLPALDHLDLALRHAEEGEAGESPSELLKGIRLVQEEVLNALGRVGVEPFSPQGEPFDPVEQEAMAQQPVESAESGTVVEVYQQGYRLNGTVLRPARVVVAA
jgi:molecular chaperone GrpE